MANSCMNNIQNFQGTKTEFNEFWALGLNLNQQFKDSIAIDLRFEPSDGTVAVKQPLQFIKFGPRSTTCFSLIVISIVWKFCMQKLQLLF